MNIQEKTFGYFTQEDWLEIKDHIKEVLKEDIDNLIEEEYIFDIDYIREVENKYLKQAVKEVVEELLEERKTEIKQLIKETIREEIKNGN